MTECIVNESMMDVGKVRELYNSVVSTIRRIWENLKTKLIPLVMEFVQTYKPRYKYMKRMKNRRLLYSKRNLMRKKRRQYHGK